MTNFTQNEFQQLECAAFYISNGTQSFFVYHVTGHVTFNEQKQWNIRSNQLALLVHHHRVCFML